MPEGVGRARSWKRRRPDRKEQGGEIQDTDGQAKQQEEEVVEEEKERARRVLGRHSREQWSTDTISCRHVNLNRKCHLDEA